MTFKAGLIAIVLAASAAGTANAAAYSDRTTFLAAIAPAPTVIDFAGLVGTPAFPPYTPGGFAINTGYTLNGVTFTPDLTFGQPFVYIFDPSSEFSLAGSASGLFNPRGGLMTLATPATAFGFDFGTSTGAGNFSIDVNFVGGGTTSTPINFNAGTGSRFFGFAGASAIASVAVRDPSETTVYIKYDNVTLGTFSGNAGAIPEPASWALMLAGFGLTGATLRRKRRALAEVPA